MTAVNALLVRLTDAVLTPLAGLPAVAVVTACALASALLVLAVMRWTSNQTALAAVKRRIHASLLEMRLYNDDVRALIRAQGEALRHNVSYVGLSLVPLIVTAVPLVLVITQLQAWYGYTGVAPGVPVLITAAVEAASASPLPRLDATGVDVVGPARYFPTLGEVSWTVVPRTPGETTLRVVQADGRVAEKSMAVADGGRSARRSPIRERASFWGQLLYPSEPPLEIASGITAIRLPYPERSLRVVGWDVHWLYLYVAAMFAFVLLLRKPLGVVI